MSGQRDTREARALAFLQTRGQASAIEIGAAAVAGEPWAAGPKMWKAKAGIGLSIAVSFARSGLVEATRTNRFRITTPTV